MQNWDFFWEQIWTLVPFGTKSQIWDFIRRPEREAAKKKPFFLGYLSQICLPTHPRVFVRFGKTEGEIWVEKGDFRGDLGGF